MGVETILYIVSSVMGIASVFLGAKWLKGKGKIKTFSMLGKESLDVIIACVDAIEDDKITKEEIEEIKKEALEVADIWGELVGKDEE